MIRSALDKMYPLLWASLLVSSSIAEESPKAPPAVPQSAPKISSFAATNHYGEYVVVTGKVAQVNLGRNMVYLAVDHPFPDNLFTAVVFKDAASRFRLKEFEGKNVEITGVIHQFRGMPEIKLTATNQIRIVEQKLPSKAPN